MTATKDRKKTALTFEAGELLDALTAVSRAISHGPKPILQNVRIGDGLITATDLEVRIDREIGQQCEAFLLPSARLTQILKSLPKDADVAITPNGTSVTIKAGGGRWEIPTEDAAEFPHWEPANLKPVCRLPADQFLRAATATVYATDNSSSRFALGAVLLEVENGNPTFVATDGRRLSCVETETDQAVDDRKVLIPARSLTLVNGMFKKKQKAALDDEDDENQEREGDIDADFSSVQVLCNQSEVVFTIAKTTITARLIAGNFPRWRDVVGQPEGTPSVVDVRELLAATKAASVVTSEQSKGVRVDWIKERAVLSAESAEYGTSEVKCPAVSVGSTSRTKVDPSYLRQFLANIPKDEQPHVDVYAADSQSRVILKCGPYTGVIMPLAEDA